MRNRELRWFALAACLGCVASVRPDEQVAPEGLDACVEGRAPQAYFPPTHGWGLERRPGAWEKASAFTSCWYARQLQAAGEQPLWPTDPAVDALRFTWLRTFHHPVVVRIEHTAGHTSASFVEMTGAGGYSPGRVYRHWTTELSTSLWEKLSRETDAIGFWGAAPPSDDRLGADGAEWILEGVRAGEYRAISIWSPDEKVNTAFRDLCLHLVEAGNWRMPRPVY